MTASADAPQLFISYSWTSPEHEAWVMHLAEELATNGVHVIIDKWDLKEGHDKYAFMERMVTDKDIKKVVMVCDCAYTAKADGREGGVGTETQIITPELYGKVEQDKFCAVIAERDAGGEACVPTYFKGKIYIDLSSSELYDQNFEQLVRWVYDRPLHIRPELGKRPTFLDEDTTGILLGTQTLYRRAVEAVRTDKPYADAALREYLETATANLERFRIHVKNEGNPDDQVVDSITKFLSARDELVSIFLAVAQYRATSESYELLHTFFEQLIPYLDRPRNLEGSHTEWDYDNYRFIIHELFLYCIAALIKYMRFDGIQYLLRQHYYALLWTREPKMERYTVFRQHMQSLESRRQRLHRASSRADLLNDRATLTSISFQQVMQSDLVLLIRDILHVLTTDERQRWWPESLIYSGRFPQVAELFVRAASKRYYDRMAVMFDNPQPAELDAVADAAVAGRVRMPGSDFLDVDIKTLMNYGQLATLP